MLRTDITRWDATTDANLRSHLLQLEAAPDAIAIQSEAADMDASACWPATVACQ